MKYYLMIGPGWSIYQRYFDKYKCIYSDDPINYNSIITTKQINDYADIYCSDRWIDEDELRTFLLEHM